MSVNVRMRQDLLFFFCEMVPGVSRTFTVYMSQMLVDHCIQTPSIFERLNFVLFSKHAFELQHQTISVAYCRLQVLKNFIWIYNDQSSLLIFKENFLFLTSSLLLQRIADKLSCLMCFTRMPSNRVASRGFAQLMDNSIINNFMRFVSYSLRWMY